MHRQGSGSEEKILLPFKQVGDAAAKLKQVTSVSDAKPIQLVSNDPKPLGKVVNKLNTPQNLSAILSARNASALEKGGM